VFVYQRDQITRAQRKNNQVNIDIDLKQKKKKDRHGLTRKEKYQTIYIIFFVNMHRVNIDRGYYNLAYTHKTRRFTSHRTYNIYIYI